MFNGVYCQVSVHRTQALGPDSMQVPVHRITVGNTCILALEALLRLKLPRKRLLGSSRNFLILFGFPCNRLQFSLDVSLKALATSESDKLQELQVSLWNIPPPDQTHSSSSAHICLQTDAVPRTPSSREGLQDSLLTSPWLRGRGWTGARFVPSACPTAGRTAGYVRPAKSLL